MSIILIIGFLMIACYMEKLCDIEEKKLKFLREMAFDTLEIKFYLKNLKYMMEVSND